MAYFESLAPVEIGPIQDSPENPFFGDISLGVNMELNRDGQMQDLALSGEARLTEEQVALLSEFALSSRLHAIREGRVAESKRSFHGIRVRNGTKNLRSFPHIDNRDPNNSFFEQLIKYGADGQYVFVTGREAPICYQGRFKLPERLPGILVPFYIAIMQGRNIRQAEAIPLKPDTLYQLGFSTVHTAPSSNRVGLFIGGYVSTR